MDLATLTSREIQDLITFYSFERKKLEYQLSKIDGNLEELRGKIDLDLFTKRESKKQEEIAPIEEKLTEVILEVEESKIEIPKEKEEEIEVPEVIEAEVEVEKIELKKETIKPAKRKRGRPRKNKKTEIESKSAISKQVTEKKAAETKKAVAQKTEKKQKKTASQEKKRIPLAPRLKYSKELKDREQRLAAEAVKKSQAEKEKGKKTELFLSDMDNLLLETVRIKNRLVHRAEFDEIVKKWATTQHLDATPEQLYRRISKSLHRLTSTKYNLLRKFNAEGKRIFAYGDANWFFKKTGKVKKQYEDKLPN